MRPVLKATTFLPKDVCGNAMCVVCGDGGRSSSSKSVVIVQYTVGGKRTFSSERDVSCTCASMRRFGTSGEK